MTRTKYRFDQFDLLELLKKKSNVGWVGLNGQVLVVKKFQHLDAVVEAGYFPELRVLINKLKEQQQDEYHDVQAARDEDSNDDGCGWHNFYYYQGIETSMLRSICLDYIYRKGWGRIGTFRRAGVDYLELECKEEHRRKLGKYASIMADLLQQTLKISIVEDIIIPKDSSLSHKVDLEDIGFGPITWKR